MKKLIIGALALTLLLAVTLSLILTSRAHAASSSSSKQVVFSGLALTAQTPVGFWIWCEGESSNPYLGECAGSMYFYALSITKSVAGQVSKVSAGQYLMTVQSSDGSVSCNLENVPPPTSGPTNTVKVSCNAPSVSGISTNAVVNVTGP